MDAWFSYPNRTLCAVLEEMRAYLKALDATEHKRLVGYLRPCVEEIQTYANRMESAMEDQDDIRKMHKKRSDLNKEIKVLKALLKDLKPKEQE